MKEIDDLTLSILDWQETGEGFQAIMTEVSRLILRYPMRHYGWTRDACADFYCFFYKRCVRLLEYFVYQDKSFIALLNNSMSWQLRTYYRQFRLKEKKSGCVKYDSIIQAEEACECCGEIRLEVSDEAKKMLRIGDSGEIENIWMKKRILILALKTAPYLNDGYIAAVSKLTGCDETWLTSAILDLRGRMDERLKRLNLFCVRTNRAFIEICQIHRDIGICCSEKEKMMLFAKLVKVKRRFDKASEGKASVKLMPTNAEIAEIMQIPKGSIDSSLYYLKRYLKALAQ
ncbi:MAG: hypothetical protein JEZ04_15830 [Spirochaetales bacterium]|nr:hypothetical protein [Spirochaetales bacterium]